MKQFKPQQGGYSLVEVLVAISVLLIASVGPMTIAATALQYARYSAEQTTAFFLAQEGIEAIVKMRNDAGLSHNNNTSIESWNWVDADRIDDCVIDDGQGGDVGCGLDWRDQTPDSPATQVVNCNTLENCRLYFNAANTRARYSHENSGEPTPYTRVIQIEQISSTEALVISTVTWEDSATGNTRTVALETYLHDLYDTN